MRTLYSLTIPSILVAVLALAAPAQTITTVSILEKAGVTTANYPVTLSMVFRSGDVTNNVTAKIGGQTLTTQTDVKVRWPNNSVKHALVSFVIPSLQSGSTALVEFTNGGTNANSTYLTKTQLLATDFDARMTVTPEGGTATTVTARNLLNGISTPEYWIQGEVCSEFLVRNFTQNINNQINVQYYVRKYPGWDGFRVDTVVENVWGDYRGNLEYDFNLELGNSNPQSVFSKTNFVHTFNARWHKTIWQGNTPPAIEIRYNLPYMIATGLLPKYDTNLVVPESTIASRYTTWSNSGHDIMDNGIMTVYFGGTGGREDIGLFPTWTARYLISMDNRCKEIMLNCADLSGSLPIHVRESDSNRSFYQHILSIDDRPTIWISDPANPNRQTAADRLPAAVGPLTSEWSVDRAHQPSLAYIPYVVTGDFYYLEEMYFWAGWDLADGNWGYRLSDTGLIADQVRGEAWAIRNIGDAGHIAPDAHALEKSYFIEKVNNNIDAWEAEYVANTANYPTVHFWQRQTNMAYDGGNVDTTIDSTCRHYSSPWMEDFLIVTFAHLKSAGFDTGGLLDWVGDSRVNLFVQAGYNPNRGAPYHLPITYNDGNNGGIPYATWADVDNAYVDDVGPSDLPNPDYAFSYTYVARAALSNLLHLTNGQTAWDWLDSHIHTQSCLNDDPTWAFVPWVAYPDVTAPSAVTSLAASSFTNTTCVLTWNAPGDDGSSGRATQYDIRYSTSTITSANWASATQVSGEPVPAASSTSQNMTVTGLPSATTLYFAMKTLDDVPNTSALSNVVSGVTGPAVPPTVQFTSGTSSDSETVTAFNLNVALNYSSTLAITVNYAVTGGTAGGGGVDYTLASGTLTFDPGQTSKQIAVTVVNDSAVEMDETIVVTLSGPFNATLGTNAAHTYTILDDDSAALPTVQFQSSTASGGEGASPANLTLTLSAASDRVVTVDYAVSGGTATQDTDFVMPGASAFVAALKRDAGLTAGGALSSQFTSLTAANVAITSVKDAQMYNAGNGRYYNYGASTSATSGTYMILGYDLSAYAGATVNRAELRIRTSGNSTLSWAGVKSHDWVEGNKTGTFPGSSPAAPGVCPAHPAGTYTAASGAAGWGNNGNTFMDMTGDGVDLYAWTTFTSYPSGTAFCVADVTSLVQDWCNGGKPNYGLLINLTNHTGYTSEQGTVDQPVLFIDYTMPGGRIAFQPGETTKTIAVTITDDAASEANETFTVTLTSASAARLGTTTAQTYTIIDNDNLAPTVNAGTDQSIDLAGTATLDATASDDGLPNPPAALTYTWSKVSGPGTVTFGSASAIDTTATFSVIGTYVLQITASDSVLQASDTVTVSVLAPPAVQFATTTSSGSEATSPASLTVSLNRSAAANITIDYKVTGGTAAGGLDYSITGSGGDVVALKRTASLTSGGALSSQFGALGSGDVVTTAVKDAELYNAGNGRYYNYGVSTSALYYAIMSVDVSAYAAVTINKAELRLRCTAGNTAMSWAGVKSHDWAEGNKNNAFPGSGTAAEGVCVASPFGLYTAPSGALGWGSSSNAYLDFTGNGADLYGWTNFTSNPAGTAWCVADVTSLVSDWVMGTKANYGLVVNLGNHASYLSEQGTADQPVLFLDYTVQGGQLTFTPGQTSRTIDLNIVNDVLVDPSETIVVTLSNAVGADLGANTTHTYTISDND